MLNENIGKVLQLAKRDKGSTESGNNPEESKINKTKSQREIDDVPLYESGESCEELKSDSFKVNYSVF